MISVIVPVYNGEAFLKTCMESILSQDEPLELLVIDDGSTDTSTAVCEAMAGRDSRVRLLRQENAGVSGARNRGLQEARGDYITFVDADDQLAPMALKTLQGAMEKQVDLVVGSHEYFRFFHRKPVLHEKRTVFLREEKNPEALVSLMCGKLYRRSILRQHHIRFREGLPYGEDTCFNLEYCRYAGKIAVLPELVYRCRMGGKASACRYYPNRDEIALELLGAYCCFYGGVQIIPAQILERLLERELTETALHYLVHASPETARKKLDAMLGSLPRPYGERDSQQLLRAVRSQCWKRLLLRKIRKWIKGSSL